MKKARKYKWLIAYPIIVLAVSGNLEAIEMVLKHFERYIIKMSKRQFYDIKGNIYYRMDEEIRHTIESKLIMKKFQQSLFLQ